MILIIRSSALILLCSVCYVHSFPSFFDNFPSLDAIKSSISKGAASIANTVGLPQMNPLRILEESPKEECPSVKTEMGKVKGVAEYSRKHDVFFAYYGIPYGKPPVGNLRFEPPQAFDEPWATEKVAKDYQSACIQFDMVLAGGVTGSEDCLYLNVFTKEISPEKPVPVIVVLGGGLLGTSSKEYHPRYIMDFPVVFVSLEYRLGALGFLNTGDGTLKGNQGLKDQQLALKWVKQNIKSFGGDPAQVTLMGNAFGAISTHFHVLSESSKGLFNRAIMLSGNALMPSAFIHNPATQFKTFAEEFDCPVEDVKKWSTCMKKKDAVDIVSAHSNTESPIAKGHEFFAPTAEVAGPDAIITQDPFALLEGGKAASIPIIFGVNEGEGGAIAARIEAHDELKKTLDISWDSYAPLLVKYSSELTNVAKALKSHYIVKGSDLEKDLTPVMKMLSETNYFLPTHMALDYHRKSNPDVYLYWYTYKNVHKTYIAVKAYKKDSFIKGKLSIASSFASNLFSKVVGTTSPSDSWGPIEGDELKLLFFAATPTEIVKDSKDYETSKAFVKTITDFSKGAKPLQFSNVEWAPVQKEGKMTAMTIDNVAEVIDEPYAVDMPFLAGQHIRDPPSKHPSYYAEF